MAVDRMERDGSSSSGSQKPSNENVLDLGSFMDHYYRVRDQLWPLGGLIMEINKIRRWENYGISFTVVLILSFSLLYPRALVAAISGVLFMLILAGNHFVLGSFIGSHKKINKPPTTPRLINEDAEVMEERSREEKNKQKSLRDYRYIIKRADDALIELAYVLDTFRSVYNWENPRSSLNTCFFLLVVSLSMLWFSVSTLSSVLAVLFFCCNEHFYNRTKAKILKARHFFRLSRQISQSRLPSTTSIADAIVRPFRPPASPTQPAGDELTSSEEVNERAVKKDKGVCFRCGASFANLLKRKHTCVNCGRVCCGSCTAKVTRASLGATSPAAFQQTVRVCLDCKNDLQGTTVTAEEQAS